MKFSFFYAIVALFATAQAVSVRTPEPDVAAENDPTVPKCTIPVTVHRAIYAYRLASHWKTL
ncbi:hypothetical protein K443DRAFT_685327, partial [Laccaria amethystina LaAM-08-1]